MFARKLIAAFSLLAALSLAHGATAWWIAAEAEHRVSRGRIATDLYGALWVLDAELGALFYALSAGVGEAPVTDGPAPLLASIQAKRGQLHELAAAATEMDAARGKPLAEHEARRRRLDRIDDHWAGVMADWDRAAAAPGGSASLDLTARLAPDGALAQTVREALRGEREAVAAERTIADDGLARVRWVALIATVAFGCMAVVLAFGLYRLLRRPVAELATGLAAFEADQLTHRIPERRPDEFGQLAASANRMAERLSRARAAEAQLRNTLEGQVADRTARLERAIAELAAADRRRQQLFAEIGHELRTPATVIRGEAEVALRQPSGDPDHYRAALGRIVDGSRQLARVIDDLLNLARERVEDWRMEAQSLDANATLTAVLATAEANGVRLERDLEHGAAHLLADDTRLRQIIGILLDNATRYGPPDGPIAVRTRIQNQHWVLQIADHGIGIAADELPHLFEHGYRGRTARLVAAAGSGLGLAIARQLTERHGGELHLASPGPDQGSTATLRLPLERAA